MLYLQTCFQHSRHPKFSQLLYSHTLQLWSHCKEADNFYYNKNNSYVVRWPCNSIHFIFWNLHGWLSVCFKYSFALNAKQRFCQLWSNDMLHMLIQHALHLFIKIVVEWCWWRQSSSYLLLWFRELDHAMLRRLEKRILVDLPTEDAREAMFRHHLPPLITPESHGLELTADIDYRTLAKVVCWVNYIKHFVPATCDKDIIPSAKWIW